MTGHSKPKTTKAHKPTTLLDVPDRVPYADGVPYLAVKIDDRKYFVTKGEGVEAFFNLVDDADGMIPSNLSLKLATVMGPDSEQGIEVVQQLLATPAKQDWKRLVQVDGTFQIEGVRQIRPTPTEKDFGKPEAGFVRVVNLSDRNGIRIAGVGIPGGTHHDFTKAELTPDVMKKLGGYVKTNGARVINGSK